MIYAVLRPHREVTGAFTLKIEPTETDAKVLGLSQEGPEELEMQSGFFLSDQDAINAVRAMVGGSVEITVNHLEQSHVV